MIKNERQYRITKAQADKFEATIAGLQVAPENKRIHPKLQKAQIDGLRSQLADLRRELEEYEALRSGRRKVLELNSFEDLPRALIQARIASGMSQEELAKRLGLKAQQIQRYEATDYGAASLARVSDIAKAVGLQVKEDVLLPGGEFSVSNLLKRLSAAGLNPDFVLRRLLPRPADVGWGLEPDDENHEVALEAAESLHRIYGWSPAALFGSAPLDLQSTASATARFKLPSRVRETGLGPYVVYAHYLALLVVQGTPQIKAGALAADASEVRREIIGQFGELSFESVLRYMWSKGVVVLPLNDSGAFHGACWRFRGRNVIVLKQRTRSAARWLHDLLHEYLHAAQNPDLEEHPVIEEAEMSVHRRTSPEEQAASNFAGDVMLNGRAEELAQQCVDVAKGKVEWLKNAVPSVARAAGVPVDALANYMAFRLALQGINWWGTATNLQGDGLSLMCTPRELLLEQVNLGLLNPIDRDLLMRALEPLVLGFAGKIGSGKSTISAEVARALGWPRASFGDYLRTVAKSNGFGESREVLQELGASLVEKGAEEFCRAVLAHYQWNAGEPLVVDGIRHTEVVEALRRLVAPLELRLIFLDVDDTTRRDRLRQIDEDTPTKRQLVEAHRTEEQVNERLPALADLRLPGNQPVAQLVSTVVNWVHQGDGTICTA
jgi:transcriptional regulator with XRE-family HTH domain/dephospho-CoA kinase